MYKVTAYCLCTISQNIIHQLKIFFKISNNVTPTVADKAPK